ncbi:MAG: hypothetical protein WBQ85_00965 [Candidatus Sulfotelmatobacter sp.]|jgi:hypothetical protein
MRKTVKAVSILAILVLAATTLAGTAAAADNSGSIAIVFKDGHRQTLDIADIARIDFKSPVVIVFKDGHQENLPATVARIDFEPADSASLPSRNHFVGKWEVGMGGDGGNFYITLESDGQAQKTHGESHGTWVLVNGEARISWDDGWHDVIRKVGSKHEKLAYEPGKSFDDSPSNITAARNTEPRPI